MPTHRDYVSWAFEGWLKTNKVTGKVLDVGCRDECFKGYLESKGLEWVGLDIEGSPTIKGRMEDMPIPDDSYDLIFVCHALEHCERIIDALREFKRVLKKGGKVFIATPSPCEHQTIRADKDHIFVLNSMQMFKLVYYVGFDFPSSYTQTEDIAKEQDYNVITTGVKK